MAAEVRDFQPAALAFDWDTTFRTAWMEDREYAVIHLQDGRRIMGAVRGYSSRQAGGHVALRDARWLADDKQEEEELDLHACPLLLVPGEEIRFVEFLPGRSENEDSES
ncbi:MAG: hypothetical protein KatS3mg111_3152 [Pirellulaceae bacterium]|nr:MAG: hypothetical protein KatS3mg111_3152 [Pirellulaceae bacterium]